jgi:MFS family permease
MLDGSTIGRFDAGVNNAPTALKRAISKAKWRLLPFLMLLYVFNFLDRVNIGFAALQMNRDLGLSPTVFGFAAGVSFISYVSLEIPSNVILLRVGARRWIGRIMISWGLISAATAFAQGPISLSVRRSRGGIYPGHPVLYVDLVPEIGEGASDFPLLLWGRGLDAARCTSVGSPDVST